MYFLSIFCFLRKMWRIWGAGLEIISCFVFSKNVGCARFFGFVSLPVALSLCILFFLFVVRFISSIFGVFFIKKSLLFFFGGTVSNFIFRRYL